MLQTLLYTRLAELEMCGRQNLRPDIAVPSFLVVSPTTRRRTCRRRSYVFIFYSPTLVEQNR